MKKTQDLPELKEMQAKLTKTENELTKTKFELNECQKTIKRSKIREGRQNKMVDKTFATTEHAYEGATCMISIDSDSDDDSSECSVDEYDYNYKAKAQEEKPKFTMKVGGKVHVVNIKKTPVMVDSFEKHCQEKSSGEVVEHMFG